MAFTKIVSPGIDTTGSYTVRDLNAVGVVTASAFSGPLTGNATGLTGTPDITVGAITAASADFSGNVSIGGTLTYEDVTNIDSVGLITARLGIKVPDSQKVFLGTGDDLQIYHDGSHSYVLDNGIGDLRLASNSITRITKGDSETCAAFNVDGASELYYDNSKKFETKSDGIDVTGEVQCDTLDVDGLANIQGSLTVQSDILMGDDDLLKLGDSDDLQISHNGTVSIIDGRFHPIEIRHQSEVTLNLMMMVQ